MSTKIGVRITWAALALGLIANIIGVLTSGTAWWVWTLWAVIATGTLALHIVARREGLM
ncbi:hypothetical protein [Nocardiopsis alba]|uniref:hypothetical protein n=1 Tax=Nocardiopsis alba TaxID=53437 RepID=UPI0035D678C7